MKIVSIETGILNTPLIAPFKTAVRRVDAMTGVPARITDGGGPSDLGQLVHYRR
ncbi:hypothetical protein [Pyramidobacter porci]|uniref:hypothetical protein n=1 Tax=Pyramidobacter porci TaxID=2605789 RepID=UPI0012B1EA62|nr:hypothetical protein [Pyramidobacter porci]MCI6260987.1 hypothetical protein [Pyramidobacter sp.]